MRELTDAILNWSAARTPVEAALGFLVLNIVIFAAALLGGQFLVVRFARHPVTDPPPPLERQEGVLAALCVALNAAVTVAGWYLWRAGIITVHRDVGWRVWLDAFVL